MDATSMTPTKNPHATPMDINIDERVEAWTVEQAADVLKATSISTPRLSRGRSVTLDIALDDDLHQASSPLQTRKRTEPSHTVYKRREPIRRDSLNRRNAVLKGKEGSRRRQRWENDRLLSNPHAEPPLPSDWAVCPTHNVHSVPYFLAPLWDAEFAKKAAARRAAAAERTQPASREEAAAQKVTRDLRAKLKRAQGAKGLLQDLELEVRGFVQQWEEKQRQLEKEGLIEETDSEDDEIVFVGRNGTMSDEKKQSKQEGALMKDKLIFQSLVDDHGASFGYVLHHLALRVITLFADFALSRYLVHAIGIYYGLKTWSVTTDGRREAYVGLKEDPLTRRPEPLKSELPRPLWAVV